MNVKDISDVNHYLLLHGHKTNIDRFELNDNVLSCVKDLSAIEIEDLDSNTFPIISKLSMKKSASDFMNSRFKLHRVGHLSNAKLVRVLKDRRIRTVDDIVPIYNAAADFIDPFKIPIDYSFNSLFGGTLVVQHIVTEEQSYFAELLPKLNNFFTNIVLPKKVTSIASLSYVHEITHTQLESNKGIVEDFYNGELLSIFMELLHADETNPLLFKVDIINRIENLLFNFYSMYLYEVGQENPEKADYNEYDYFSDAKYFISILKAFELYHLYVTSDDKIKQYIISGIQHVFDGIITLEDFLESVDVSYTGALTSEYSKYFIKKIQ